MSGAEFADASPADRTDALRFLPCGDTAVSVDFGDRIDASLNARVMALDAALARTMPEGVIETVPTYRSLLVHFDPLAIGYDELCGQLHDLARQPPADAKAHRRWRVPVAYGGAFGEDLESISSHCGFEPEAFAQLHAAGRYRVAMIGFVPGFCYLGGLDPKLAMPRRPVPRPRIPASSIAIGHAQTAIGSIVSPSGWHLIGRTPVRPFQRGRDPVFLFEPGDEIRFEVISETDFAELDKAANGGEYVARLAE